MKRNILPSKVIQLAVAATLIHGASWQALASEAQRLPIAANVHPSITAPPPALTTKQMLRGAIQLQITPKGMKYFETNLSELLSNMGFNFEEALFPSFTWQSEKSYKVDDLNLPAEQRELVQMVSSMLTKWLVGFSIKEFRPSIKIGNTGYMAQFNRMAIVTDEKLMRALGKTEGAVLALELEVPNLTVATESVRASDQNNQIFGEIGADNVTMTVASAQNPLKIRLPVYVRTNQRGELEFEAVRFDSNIATVDMNLSYQKLITPQVVIEINGNRYEMNQKQLEAEMKERLPQILQKTREFLATFAMNDVPALLNKNAKDLLGGSLEEVNSMTPPGAVTKDKQGRPVFVPPFSWGMKVSQIGLNQSLNLGLDGFVEDTYKAKSTLPLKDAGSRGRPNFAAFAADSHDIGLSIDRGFINRMLQLSFERGLFNNMEMDGGDAMRLTKVPQLDYINPRLVQFNPKPNTDKIFLKLRTRVLVPKGMATKFKEKMALKEPFEIDLDLVLKMMKNSKGEVWMYYHDVDPASVAIDDKYLTTVGKMFRDTVHEGVREKLATMAVDWRKQSKLMTEEPFPIPTELMGIQFGIHKLSFDPAGHLIVLLKYTQNKSVIDARARGGQ